MAASWLPLPKKGTIDSTNVCSSLKKRLLSFFLCFPSATTGFLASAAGAVSPSIRWWCWWDSVLLSSLWGTCTVGVNRRGWWGWAYTDVMWGYLRTGSPRGTARCSILGTTILGLLWRRGVDSKLELIEKPEANPEGLLLLL